MSGRTEAGMTAPANPILLARRSLDFVHALGGFLDRDLAIEKNLAQAVDFLKFRSARIGMCGRGSGRRHQLENLDRRRALDRLGIDLGIGSHGAGIVEEDLLEFGRSKNLGEFDREIGIRRSLVHAIADAAGYRELRLAFLLVRCD